MKKGLDKSQALWHNRYSKKKTSKRKLKKGKIKMTILDDLRITVFDLENELNREEQDLEWIYHLRDRIKELAEKL